MTHAIRQALLEHAAQTVPSLVGRAVYVAGPMSGLPEYNRPAFFAAAEYLAAQGARVMNPAVLPDGFTWEQYLRVSKEMLMCCDVIALLPGWEKSRGALVEARRAEAFAFDAIRLQVQGHGFMSLADELKQLDPVVQE